MSLDAIFKAYDVRGLYPEEIDEALARRIGNAFAHFTGAQQLIVGHDMRPSSEPLAASIIPIAAHNMPPRTIEPNSRRMASGDRWVGAATPTTMPRLRAS